MSTTMLDDEALGRIKMGVNVDIKRSDGKFILYLSHFNKHDDSSKPICQNILYLVRKIRHFILIDFYTKLKYN